MIDSKANTCVMFWVKAGKTLVVVTYVGAAASEYETDNAKPIDEKRQVYMYQWR